MEKLELLYEGKAKKVYTTEDPDVLIVDYKDDATAFNGQKKGTIVGKGAINNRMTNHIFKLLEKEGIPTHLIEELSDRETAVKKVEIVPLEVIIRNVAAGSFSKKLGIEEGKKLLAPTLEFSYKDDALGDPMINDYYAIAIGATYKDFYLVGCDTQDVKIILYKGGFPQLNPEPVGRNKGRIQVSFFVSFFVFLVSLGITIAVGFSLTDLGLAAFNWLYTGEMSKSEGSPDTISKFFFSLIKSSTEIY